MLLAAVLYALSVSCRALAREDAGFTHILLEQSVDAAAGEAVLSQDAAEEETLGFCFWGEAEQQRVSCRETGASVQVTQVFLAGNPELLGAGILAWQRGCLIDEATAQALFGTVLCGGQSLWHDGTAYRVLGTVSSLRPTMLTMAEPGDGACLSRCVLSAPAETGKVQGEQFLLRYGLWGKVLDFYPLWALTENLLLLFPGILLLAVWGRLGRGWRRLTFPGIASGSQLQLLGRAVLALGLTIGTLWGLGRRLIIPPDMIPSRWSDFSFWGTWWEAQRENLLLLLFTPLGNRQLQMLLNMVKSMGTSTAAAVLALWAVRRQSNADIADRG